MALKDKLSAYGDTLVSGAINAGMNALTMGAQRRNQEKLMDKQANINEQAADAALAREMQMYDYTYNKQSYAAQRKQLEDAGLSVGLMYGGGAAGAGMGVGGSAPQGGTTGGTAGMAQPFHIDPLTMAQIENIKADTKNKEQENEQISANTAYTQELTTQLEQNGELQRLALMYEILNQEYENNGKAGESFTMTIGNREFKIGDESIKGTRIVAELAKTMTETMKTGNEAQKAIAETIESSARVEKMFNDMLMDAMELQIQFRHLEILDEQNQINWARYEDEKGKGAREWKNLEIMESQAKAMASKIEYETGEKVNWKNITETVISGIGAIGNTIGNIYGAKKLGAILGPKETTTYTEVRNGKGRLKSSTSTRSTSNK